ncbi:MAG: glycosyl transferase family 1 [Sulfurovum sp. PC08-66]|nr:MAG: glycosyl transferase family 1 [Sulfurovum sp. PC08-66]KIM12438.1 MAG: glycosyl transferase family 1 [Sulfuricurvum sp. PC08-66]
MKILQLGKFYPPHIGGIETVMYDIVEVLNQKGYRTDVLCSNKGYMYSEEIEQGYKVVRTKSFGIKFSTSITPQMVLKLKNMIRDYDIVHVHLPDPMATLALFLVGTKNKKIVLHWHSDIIKQKYLLRLFEPLQNWIMRNADLIIATTPKYIEESKYLQKYKEKCVPIPIGIDSDRLTVNHNLVLKIKNENHGKKIVFSLGRLTYYKGFEYLINAAKELDEGTVVLIGGSGELMNDLLELIDKNELSKKVKLVGKISNENLGSYYSACDIFCLPSIAKSEAFGIVQIEAMSFGKPVVATRIAGSGVDWVNQHNVTGKNVEPKNAKVLADAFKQIMCDEETYVYLANNARKRFEELFERGQMVDKIVEAYKKL